MRASLPICLLLAATAAGCDGSPDASAAPNRSEVAAPSADATSRSSETAPSSAAGAAWQLLDDAPVARLEMAAAAHDGRIWLVGGLSPLGEALADVEVFDPASGEWSDGPSLPTGVHHAALVSDGNRLVLVGGYIGSSFSTPTELVLVLADGADEWAPGPPLPEPRAAGAAAWDGERVVYAGGVGAGGLAADVNGLAGDAWTRIGSMRDPREHLAAASDGLGTTWLLGGRVGGLNANVATVEVVAGDTIELGPPLTTPRGGVAGFYAPGLGACLTGGEAPDRAYTDVECVAVDGTLTALPDLVEPHHGHGAAVVGATAYVLLGGPEPGLTADATVEALRLDRLAR